MSDKKQLLSAETIQTELESEPLTGWFRDGDQIVRTFDTGDFATGLKLVNLIGADAETDDHHPDILLTYPDVTVTLTSHDVGGVTVRDLDLARKANAHALRLRIL